MALHRSFEDASGLDDMVHATTIAASTRDQLQAGDPRLLPAARRSVRGLLTRGSRESERD